MTFNDLMSFMVQWNRRKRTWLSTVCSAVPMSIRKIKVPVEHFLQPQLLKEI